MSQSNSHSTSICRLLRENMMYQHVVFDTAITILENQEWDIDSLHDIIRTAVLEYNRTHNIFIDKVFKTNLRNRLGEMNRCEGKEPSYLLDWIDIL